MIRVSLQHLLSSVFAVLCFAFHAGAADIPHLLISRQGANEVIEVMPNGETSVFVSDLPGVAGDIAFDSACNVYLLVKTEGRLSQLLKIDPYTHAVVQSYSLPDHSAGLAIRGNQAYIGNEGEYGLLKLNLINGSSVPINDPRDWAWEGFISRLTFGPDGMLYGIDGEGDLFRIDPATGISSALRPCFIAPDRCDTGWSARNTSFDDRGRMYVQQHGSTIAQVTAGDGIFGNFFSDRKTNFVDSAAPISGLEIFDNELIFCSNETLVTLNISTRQLSSICPFEGTVHQIVRRPVPNDLLGTIQFEKQIYTVREGSKAIVTLVRHGGTNVAAQVELRTRDGGAKQGVDYKAIRGVVKFAVGQTKKSVAIPVLNDAADEENGSWYENGDALVLNESFRLFLSNPTAGATLGSQVSTTISIKDDYDGSPSLLLQHSDGRLALWELEGTNITARHSLEGSYPHQRLVAVADMNRDGGQDFIWQERREGPVSVWYMAGKQKLGVATFQQGKPLGYTLLTAADWNRDSHPDFLWSLAARNTSVKSVGISYLNGLNPTSFVQLENIEPLNDEWQVIATGDMNKKGLPGTIWRHEQGALRYWNFEWRKSLAPFVYNEVLPDVVPGWKAIGIGSFSGPWWRDGIVYQHPDGRIGMKTWGTKKLVLLNGGQPVEKGWTLIACYGGSR